MAIALSETQKNRLKVLEPKLDEAIRNQNFDVAKSLVIDIQSLLRPTNHFSRLVQSKNKLYELAIELSKCDFALNGLLSNKEVVNDNTRVYLETISLIAICYLRLKEVEKAKYYIQEVLRNQKIIRSPNTRAVFHSEIINRFNEEVALATLTGIESVYLNEEEVERESIRIIRSLTDDEILTVIGEESPKSTRDLMYLVYDYSVKQLPSAERLALPSPDQKLKDKEVGVTIFESVKRIVYNSLCNSDSTVYKAWTSNGMNFVLTKGYIKTAVVSCLINVGFGVSMIAAAIVALISKIGIELYCKNNRPKYVSDFRSL